jgi:hypothetical protein
MKEHGWNPSLTRLQKSRTSALRISSWAAIVLFFLVSVFPGNDTFAQTSSTGAVTGTITDQSGGAVAGAAVKLTNAATGEVYQFTSRQNGSYLAPLLAPGDYQIEVSKTGFKTMVRTGIRVVGGHAEAKSIAGYCQSRRIPVWCGGMLESGIGRAHNIAMSTLPGFILPGDVSASQRYWEEDIIEPEVEVTARGTIRVPTGPGIGYRVRRDRVEALSVRSETFSANDRAAVVLT